MESAKKIKDGQARNLTSGKINGVFLFVDENILLFYLWYHSIPPYQDDPE
jgi:hypothetical protein